MDPRTQRERLLELLWRRLETLAQAQPVLALLEDVHWADPTTCELLDLLIARLASLPVMLVLTHRPMFQVPWIGEAHVTELRLARLNQRQGAALIGHIASASDLPPRQWRRSSHAPMECHCFLKNSPKQSWKELRMAAAPAPRPDMECQPLCSRHFSAA